MSCSQLPNISSDQKKIRQTGLNSLLEVITGVTLLPIGDTRRLRKPDMPHVEGWKDMHCKKGKWINDNAAHAWKKIDKEYNSSLSRSGGDEMEVVQIDCLKKALGSRRSHIWGVGRVLKSVTPNLFPNENRDEEDERWQRQERAIEELRQDNASLRAQMNQFLKLLPGLSTQLEEDGQEDE